MQISAINLRLESFYQREDLAFRWSSNGHASPLQWKRAYLQSSLTASIDIFRLFGVVIYDSIQFMGPMGVEHSSGPVHLILGIRHLQNFGLQVSDEEVSLFQRAGHSEWLFSVGLRLGITQRGPRCELCK